MLDSTARMRYGTKMQHSHTGVIEWHQALRRLCLTMGIPQVSVPWLRKMAHTCWFQGVTSNITLYSMWQCGSVTSRRSDSRHSLEWLCFGQIIATLCVDKMHHTQHQYKTVCHVLPSPARSVSNSPSLTSHKGQKVKPQLHPCMSVGVTLTNTNIYLELLHSGKPAV